MPTYTFFTEREGGTYISQFDKPDLLTAWDAFVADENARSGKKWLRKFGQQDKWIVCLTVGTVVPADQEKS